MEENKRIPYYVSISCVVMILIWILSYAFDSYIVDDTAIFLIAAVWIAVTIFNFVNCIRQLVINKTQKGFTITSLVLSSFLLLMFFIGIVIGIAGAGF